MERLHHSVAEPATEAFGLGKGLRLDMITRTQIAAGSVVINHLHAREGLLDGLTRIGGEVGRDQRRVLVQHRGVHGIEELYGQQGFIPCPPHRHNPDLRIAGGLGREAVAAHAIDLRRGDRHLRWHAGFDGLAGGFDNALNQLLPIRGVRLGNHGIAGHRQNRTGDRP